jgi:hypothetical protein
MGQLNDCLPCQAGYTCSDEGIGNLRGNDGLYKCPLGHYCERGINVKPQKCISGSYFDDIIEKSTSSELSFTGAYSGGGVGKSSKIQDCNLCPEGYFCPSNSTETPDYRYKHKCPEGFLCPSGSGEPQLCPPGFYCAIDEETGITVSKICPEGYYCPMGNAIPHKCDAASVCSEGASSETDTAKTRFECVPGTYLHIDSCDPCVPGFICEKHTG